MPTFNVSVVSTYCPHCDEPVCITLPISPHMLQGGKADVRVSVTSCMVAKTEWDDLVHEIVVKVKYVE